ncbi:MAG TPA: PQQ-binding-like beta-propeller repeat protein [Vicinamibacterales bacterium]
MLKRILKKTAIFIVVLTVVSTMLYWFFGLRILVSGGGQASLGFVKSADSVADDIERHRAAQRASMPATTAPSLPPAVVADATDPADAGSAVRPAGVGLSGDPRAYWTDFRGPARDGRYAEMPIFTAWPADGLKPVWKQPIGGGYASFVIAHGRAFTIEQRRAKEVVAAYDVVTGRELWTHSWDGLFQEVMGGDGPRATPTWFDDRVYAVGAHGELQCLEDDTGRMVWRTNILQDNGAVNLQWGMSAAPLIVDDSVIVLPGAPGGKSVVAYDRRTGERVWAALNDQQAYSSPMLVTLADTRQLVVLTATRLVGLTPGKGELLWQYPWATQMGINASQPLVVSDSRVFISSSYGVGAALIEISRDKDKFRVREVWRNTRMKNKFTSSVLHEGFIYGLDESILTCLDAATGDMKWKGGRYGYGQIVLASGHIIVLTEDGDLALVRATPAKHEQISRFSAIEGKTWNHPALADGYLLVRNLQEMAAYDLRARAARR